MSVIEIILLTSFVILPLYDYVKGESTKLQVLSGELTRVRCYQQTLVFLWLPTLLLLVHLWSSELSAADLGIAISLNINQAIAFLLLVLLLAYFLFALWETKQSELKKQQAAAQMEEVAWLMPTNKKELNWFVFGVSATAGICEELLFRGYLIHYLTEQIGLPLAVIISSALFGLCHSYQGWKNVLRTGFLGLVFALIYLWSGSLILVIILHFAIDAYAGSLSYLCTQYLKVPRKSGM